MLDGLPTARRRRYSFSASRRCRPHEHPRHGSDDMMAADSADAEITAVAALAAKLAGDAERLTTEDRATPDKAAEGPP